MQASDIHPMHVLFASATASRVARGFTLIELMITVAIVALLASLAYPAYTGSILKGKRAEGRAALTDLLQQQERYLTQTGSYLAFGWGASGTPFRTWSGDGSQGAAAYQLRAIACTPASGPALQMNECVELQARPNRSDPEVNVLTVTSTGARSCDGSNAAKCWR